MSERSSNGVFTDQDPVDPSWAAPDPTAVDAGWLPPETTEPKRRPRLLTVGVPVLAVILVVGLAVGFGGFKDRSDTLLDAQPGQTLESGPFEFVFTEATAKRTKNWEDKIVWEVTMIGTARTTGTISIAPNSSEGDGMFVARDPETSEVQNPTATQIGDVKGFSSVSDLTPGLAPVPYRVEFDFSETYEPGDTVRFGVIIIEYGTKYLGSDEKFWVNGSYAYLLHLPVEILPEDLD